ncbi:MAG: hypothetical protein QOI92_1245 [Chloroflexota bacterium]|nr:hypothetical protein [Chloroflexota bacterium]
MRTPGWFAIRIEIALAIGLGAFVGAIELLQPTDIGPMFKTPPSDLWLTSLPAFGVLAYLIGLAWMIRIYRADPERHRSSWRFDRS